MTALAQQNNKNKPMITFTQQNFCKHVFTLIRFYSDWKKIPSLVTLES